MSNCFCFDNINSHMADTHSCLLCMTSLRTKLRLLKQLRQLPNIALTGRHLIRVLRTINLVAHFVIIYTTLHRRTTVSSTVMKNKVMPSLNCLVKTTNPLYKLHNTALRRLWSLNTVMYYHVIIITVIYHVIYHYAIQPKWDIPSIRRLGIHQD